MRQRAGSTWQRLRAWNQRQVAWADRHPWRFAVGFATSYIGGTLTTSYALGGMPLPWTLYGVGWVLLVVIGGLAQRRRVRRRAISGERSADLPRAADPLSDDDGRRWRSGIG